MCGYINDNTSHYTVDWGDIRYYCIEHWNVVRLFFIKIGAISCKECIRNYHAETDSSFFKETTVKFCGKYWDLCSLHVIIYEDMIDYFEFILPED